MFQISKLQVLYLLFLQALSFPDTCKWFFLQLQFSDGSKKKSLISVYSAFSCNDWKNKAFLSEQCKEIEENNRMGMTRNPFKKIGDSKGILHVRIDTIKDRMAPHSSTLAWRIPWTEEPGGLQFMGLQSRTQLSN